MVLGYSRFFMNSKFLWEMLGEGGGGIYVNNLVGKQFKNLNKSQVSLMELLDIYRVVNRF